jgi:hypothetical protein
MRSMLWLTTFAYADSAPQWGARPDTDLAREIERFEERRAARHYVKQHKFAGIPAPWLKLVLLERAGALEFFAPRAHGRSVEDIQIRNELRWACEKFVAGREPKRAFTQAGFAWPAETDV